MSDCFLILKSVCDVLLIWFGFEPFDFHWFKLFSPEFIFISWCFSRLFGLDFDLNIGSWFYRTGWKLSNMLCNFAASSYVSGRDCELLKSEVARTTLLSVISLLNDSCSSASNVLLFWNSAWTVGMISSIYILFGLMFFTLSSFYWFFC